MKINKNQNSQQGYSNFLGWLRDYKDEKVNVDLSYLELYLICIFFGDIRINELQDLGLNSNFNIICDFFEDKSSGLPSTSFDIWEMQDYADDENPLIILKEEFVDLLK